MAGTSRFKKFGLLLWKNYLLQKRHIVQTIFEILLPLVFVAVLVLARDLVNSTPYPEGRTYKPFSPSDWNATVIRNNLNSQIKSSPEPLKVVLYAPTNDETDQIMANVEKEFLQFTVQFNSSTEIHEYSYTIKGFKTAEELLADYQNSYANVLGAVIFDEKDSTTYSLRLPSKQTEVWDATSEKEDKWNTALLYPIFQLLGPRNPDDNQGGRPGYYSQGFTFLQWAVDASIIRFFNGPETYVTSDEDLMGFRNTSLGDYDIRVQRYPYPAYIDDNFLVALQGWLPLILMLSFIYPVINTTKAIVVEKEKRLKESMKMMGLPNYLHWSAWFVKSFMFMLISIIFMTVLLKIKFTEGLAIITYGDGSVLFVFLLAYLFSTITLAFLISAIFSKANSASTAAGVLWFLMYFPYFFLQPRYDTMGQSTKVVTSLLSNTGMSFGCQIISMFEGTGAGVQWSTIAKGANPQDDFTLLHCILILIFDGVIYLLAALYIEAVWPGEYGVPLPWYFPFTKVYWVGASVSPDASTSNGHHTHGDNIEAPPVNGKAGIKIQGLTKVFGNKTAVKSLTLNMYENQITALLGHNGAGKTTTMSMLTGLFPPTSGTATLNNFDIRTNIQDVRDSLGLCPQHDVLFDELTVEEHLRFFCLMKGYPHVDMEINRMLTALGLEPKRHAQSSTLSGGMKRKLSVGIALIGGSKVVLLDEPTSGMDPGARRSTWDLLTAEKKNRTVVLSTHFMDEADLLGDRIAIMADGELQTVGSSLFLKKKYGGGYHLIIVKQPGCDTSRITAILRKHLGQAEVEQDVGAELSYSLPDSQSSLFGDMFEELERKRVELRIDSYGASITTMEEVFVRVGRAAEKRKEGETGVTTKISIEALQDNHDKYELYTKFEKNTGVSLFFQQLRAMIVKKMLYTSRNWGLLLVQTILPVAFLVIALIMLETLPGIADSPALPVRLTEFGSTTTTLACESESDLPDICQMYANYVVESGSTVSRVSNFTEAIINQSEKDLLTTNFEFLVGMEKTEDQLVAFFNNQPLHAPPIALNFLSSALLKKYYKPDAKITITNQPLPPSLEDDIENVSSFGSTGFSVGFNIAFGMSFLASGFVVFLIKERESKAKHLQYVSGVNFVVFWLANFILDAINFIIPCIFILIVLIAFQAETFDDATVLGNFFLLLLFYGWAVIPLMYLFSFQFSIPSTGFTRMIMLNVITGIAPFVAISIIKIPDLNLMSTADVLEWLFLIFPNYSIGYGVVSLSTNKMLGKTCNLALAINPFYCDLEDNEYNICCREYNYAENKAYGYLDMHPAGIGRNLLFLFLIGCISITALLVFESKILEKVFSKKTKSTIQDSNNNANPTEDSDVTAEASRIRKSELKELFQSNNLVMRDLSKSYGSFTAVRCLNLGVQHKECFGLLGVNGAGKTTTFKMLTGDFPTSSGDAFVYGHSINSDIKNVQQNLGYCPQFDAIIEELTGRETIRLFARLRGIKENEIDSLADRLAANLLFSEHIDKRAGAYSGGNKRKLSTALALIGNPPIVFLDEPTTGMDPVARRHLWNCITKVRDAGTSIVLTSHSMEECEALCTRLAIMVNGEFRCLGSIQHLKSKFGEGYTVIAQMSTKAEISKKSFQESLRRRSSGIKNDWEVEIEGLKKFIEESFPGSILKDVHPGYVHYHVTSPNLTWGDLFRQMEVAKSLFKLEAYSVGQTSLEQVFLNFTKSQVSDE